MIALAFLYTMVVMLYFDLRIGKLEKRIKELERDCDQV
jgi:hypothetical protein